MLIRTEAAQRPASGAPLADLEIATVDGTGQLRKMPRFTGHASGVTCTRLLGRRADTFSVCSFVQSSLASYRVNRFVYMSP